MSNANQQAKLDNKLTTSQKELFELSSNTILATENDRNVFFETLHNPPKPNKSLKEAAKQYQKHISAI
jgi:Protein of unknown function (DUF1778)